MAALSASHTPCACSNVRCAEDAARCHTERNGHDRPRLAGEVRFAVDAEPQVRTFRDRGFVEADGLAAAGRDRLEVLEAPICCRPFAHRCRLPVALLTSTVLARCQPAQSGHLYAFWRRFWRSRRAVFSAAS